MGACKRGSWRSLGTLGRLALGLVSTVLVMLTMLAAIAPQSALAAPSGWQITQLTNSTSSGIPDTDGKWLVWQRNGEVVARNLATGEEHQLSNDGKLKSGPLVDEDAVIWSVLPTGSEGVHGYLYHLPNGPLEDLGVIPNQPLSYSSGRFAYTKKVSLLTDAVYVYNLATKASTLITGDGNDPSLRGSYIAYANHDSSGWSACVVNLDTAAGVKVSTGSKASSCLYLADSALVWAVDILDDMEIYMLDRATNKVTRITNDSYEDRQPKMSGNLVVWESLRPDWEVMVYDVTTGQTTQLTDNDVYDMLPCTDGTRVYWEGITGADSQYQLFVASPAVSERPFVDVPPDHYYEEAIDGLYYLTIIGGHRIVDGQRYYDPDDSVNRAQFAKMITGTLGVPIQPASEAAAFVDLGTPDSDGYPHKYVATILQHGITQGVDSTHYGPWLPIKRAQVVTMLVRAANHLRPGFLSDPPAGYTGSIPTYTSPDHAKNLRIAEYNHLLDHLEGFGPDWNPEAPASRAECAQFMWNYLKLTGLSM